MEYKETKFKLYRYTMTPIIEQPSLLPNAKTKHELIQELFLKVNQNVSQSEENRTLVYSRIYNTKNNRFIVSKVAKQKNIKTHGSPENNFREEDIPDWPNSYLIINTDDHPKNGQLIAFEQNSQYFPDPLVALKNIKDKFNKSLNMSGWKVEIEPLTQKKSFWEYVEKNKGSVQKLTFNFNSPNLFGGKTALEEEMRVLREDSLATNLEVTLSNPSGTIDIKKSGLLKKFYAESMEYIRKGGGSWSTQNTGKRSKVKSSHDSSVEIIKTIAISAEVNKYFNEVVQTDQLSLQEDDLIISKILKKAEENE
jgi:hypothetical protein